MKTILLTVLLLGLLAAVATQLLANRHEARSDAAFPPVGRIVDVDGVPVHAVVMGQGPDLVLIHGASGSTRDMTFGFATALAARYRVIVFDRPGLGHTGRTDPAYAGPWGTEAETLTDQAVLLHAAALQLGATRPIVLGHSYGNGVALAWAIQFPDNIAALVDVAGVANAWTTPLDIQYRVVGTRLGGLLVPPLVAAYVPDAHVVQVIESIFAPQSAPAGYADQVGAALTIRRDSFRANARQVHNLLRDIKAQVPDYANIRVPVEIIHGDADTIVPLTVHSVPLASQISGANLTVLPGIGHMPHHVAQGEVIAAIDRAAARAGLR